MGRHSAPDDDEALPSERGGGAVDVAEAAAGTAAVTAGDAEAGTEATEDGRHHTAGDEPPSPSVLADAAPTEPLPTEPVPREPVPTEPAPTEHVPTEPAPTEPAPSEPPPSAPKPEVGTHADLRLLRENPSLRARCAAGVVVPFLLYTVVLVVIARVDVYLVWVWIPTVTAGVLVGTFLDIEHHRRKRR